MIATVDRNPEPDRPASDLAHFRSEPERHAGSLHLGQQHRDDLARRPVAEELTQRLLVPGDPMPVDHGDEIMLIVPAQRGFAEMRIV